MAAMVDVRHRTVMITGAIDTNDHDMLVRIDLPAAGRWQIVESETNLTNRPWWAWQVTFGEGVRLATDGAANNACRQLPGLYVADDRSRLCFHGGEVRPGEAVLKMLTVDAVNPRIVMAHNHPARDDDEPLDAPDLPPHAGSPVPFPPDLATGRHSTGEAIRRGLPSRPYVQRRLPVRQINET